LPSWVLISRRARWLRQYGALVAAPVGFTIRAGVVGANPKGYWRTDW